MNYSLGNMLGGAGALNADKLALNLQFATDKTLTARKGPTPVFTRASGATQVGASGLIEFAPENLLLQSENFGTTWTAGQLNVTGTPPYLNVATAPNGTTTAEKLIANTTNSTHQFRQDVTLVGGNTYTISAYYKAQETNFATISIVGVANGSADWVAYFNISASSPAVGFFNGFTSTAIVDVGDGWRRCSVTFTTTASGSLNTRFGGASSTTFNSNFYTGDNTSGFLIWGAQLEAHPTARTYIPTTTAAVYGARFDHDPITLACKGLLIEESRTNLQRNSSDLSLWVNGIGTTVTTNQTTAPDGTSTADLLAETSANTQHFVSDTNASVTSGTTYTLSIFAKKGIGATAPDLVQITGSSGAFGTTQYATFDIQNGSVNSSAGGTATIQAYANGWYRLAFTVTATATTTTAVIVSFVGVAPTLRLPSYIGIITSNIYLWGAQLEAGAFPTSYIPTTTASVVRSADICSISGANFTSIYNQSEGTLFVDARVETAARSANGFFAGIYNVSNNEFSTRIFSGSIQVVSRDPTSKDFSIGTATTNTKAATVYSNLNNAGSLNGSAVITGTVSTLPLMTSLGIGSRYSNTLFINGHIASVRFYKKRLANAKLVTLTA
jgi:hypothetical protein